MRVGPRVGSVSSIGGEALLGGCEPEGLARAGSQAPGLGSRVCRDLFQRPHPARNRWEERQAGQALPEALGVCVGGQHCR